MTNRRVISLGRENLDIELSDTAYRICGGFGRGESSLEIHMDGTIVRFEGELRKKEFAALAGTMVWLCPDERKAADEEFDTYVKKLKVNYKTLPRKNRIRIIFVDDKWKKLYSIR